MIVSKLSSEHNTAFVNGKSSNKNPDTGDNVAHIISQIEMFLYFYPLFRMDLNRGQLNV